MEYTDIKAKHSKTAYRALTISGISFVSAILGAFFLPPILSPIAMIISHLSKGRLKTRHFAAQAATVVAIIAFIINSVMIGFSLYRLQTDPEARAQLSTVMAKAPRIFNPNKISNIHQRQLCPNISTKQEQTKK